MITFAADLYLLVAAYGLAFPVSYAALPVLGQGAFVAVGAFGTVQLAAHGVPLLVAVGTAVAIAGLAGYVVGFAATRLAGAPLALATWGLAWLGYVVLVQFPRLSGGSQGLVRATPARLVSRTLGVAVVLHPWVHVVVGAILAAGLAAIAWRSAGGPWGLDWAALRTGPAVADSLGVPVQRRRRALLCASAAVAAVGGAGTALLLGVVSPADYSPLLSLQLFVAVLVGGVATWWGPVLGVALLAALPSVADHVADAAGIDPLRARSVLTAVLLVAALVARPAVARLLTRGAVRAGTGAERGPAATAIADGAARWAAGPAAPLLQMSGVAVRFGAVPALDGIDLDVRAGEVHALVGPNGSGKTTALRVLAGVVRPDTGDVVIGGRPAPRPGAAAARVAAGVARTFQHTALLGDLPVAAQVAIGGRAGDRLPFAGLRHLLATPGARGAAHRRDAAVARALEGTGLCAQADLPAALLDGGQQRRLQIARVAATPARALLLDEPAAGMSAPQRADLVRVLRGLAGAGRGVLLVEHDMTLVGRVADRVTVLAAGVVVATGPPADVRRDPRVRAAYLGDTDTDTDTDTDVAVPEEHRPS